MIENLKINGKALIPIKDAAKLVSYSRDYVARLAREKKIVVSQIGRQWFIDVVSLRSFVEASALEQSVRQQQLSIERKREQSLKEEMEEIKNHFQDRGRSVHFQAQLVSCVVLVFGLLVGTSLYTISSLSSDKFSQITVARLGSATENSDAAETEVAQPASENLTLAQVKPQVVTVLNSVIDKPTFADETEVKELSNINNKGIFLLPRNGQIQDIEQVKEMFSDDLNVEYVDANAGKIVYVRESGERVEFPFVSVPLRDTADVKGENF